MDISVLAQIIIVILAVVVSVIPHEVMHGVTAKWLGDDTAERMGRLTLNPIPHIDPFATIALPVMLIILGAPPLAAAKPVPVNTARLKYDEWGAALVAIAGPLTNLLMAFIAGYWVRFVLGFAAGIATDILILFMFVNIGLALFNLIPIPPLDGSRILYAFAPEPVQDFMKTMERGGLLTIMLFFFLIFPLVRPVIVNLSDSIASFILGVNFVF